MHGINGRKEHTTGKTKPERKVERRRERLCGLAVGEKKNMRKQNSTREEEPTYKSKHKQ